ncbi:fibrobacter succinogenes major paralogous domain-containing protein, partial [Bacteroides thetaiotaomicron]|nr:fibrobacter succinogenes major paralogous domain-containing protein [Bacteroides thetaiotaomicron]MDC2190341.1 fibrobacter succinogenes major paralogous domain-containing protein [Bacteroides thetaiotaomicron]
GAPNTGNNAHGFWQVPSGRWLGAGAANVNTRGTEAVPGSSSVYFPAGGYRNHSNGNTYNAGNFGYSWSGSSNGTANAYNLTVNSANAGWNYNYRYGGFTVRCIRE